MKIVSRYICEICDTEYQSPEAAEGCEIRGIRDMGAGCIPEVGDIVECGSPYGWHTFPDTIWARKFPDTEDDRWGDLDPTIKIKDGGCLAYKRIWIVAAITVEDHRRVYHLYCAEPPQGFTVCRTSPDHHGMKQAEPSAEREAWRDQNETVWRGREADHGHLV